MAKFVIVEIDTDNQLIIEKFNNVLKDATDGDLVCVPANIIRYINIEDGRAEVMKDG